MESEGQPYKVSLHDECIYIEGPRPSLDSGCSIRIDPGMGDVAKVDAIQEGLDLAYAEGRKAERERCAKIAEDLIPTHSHCEDGYKYECYTGHIIADKIRGGRDEE